MLRQQQVKTEDKPYHVRSRDFVAPVGAARDYVGAFAVTAGIGADELAARSRRSSTTTAPSSSRRSPTAWPRRSPSASTSARAATGDTRGRDLAARLVAETYRGIRPAFGYPACPDHTEKRKLFDLLGARRRHRR